MRISKCFWLWGRFSAKDTFYLNEQKNKVQSILKSPNYDIHITLAGPYFKIDNDFLSKLKFFAQNNSPLDLYLKNFNFQDETFKSFYISIVNSNDLNSIRKEILKIKKFNFEKEYQPHISLAYGKHAQNIKKELILKMPKLKESIKITKLSLVDVDETINLWNILNNFDFKKTFRSDDSKFKLNKV